MDEATARQMFEQAGTTLASTMTLWADAQQRALRELAELSASTVKEGARLYAELQQSGIEAIRDAQSAALSWQASGQRAPKDPAGWYQRGLVGTVEGAQKAFRLMESNAQAIMRSTERVHASAEMAGKSIQEGFGTAVARLKDVYAGH